MKIIDNVTKEFWDSVIAKSDHATFFHTHTWAKIITDTFPQYSSCTKGFILDDETRVVLPMVSTSAGAKGFFKAYQSLYPGVYGGPITDGRRLNQEEIDYIFSSFQGIRTGKVLIIGNPFCKYQAPDSYEKQAMFTQVIDLRKGFDEIWSGYSKGNKSSTKKAQRMEVKIDLARNLDDYKAYYIVYEDSLRRWGDEASSHYPFALFRNIFEMDSQNIELWLAKVEGKIIAGALLFYCNKHIVWWHGAALEDYFNHCPNNLLQTEIIRKACDKNYWYYDFNPSGGHEGVIRFKKSFGAERIDFTAWKWSSKSSNIYKKFRG